MTELPVIREDRSDRYDAGKLHNIIKGPKNRLNRTAMQLADLTDHLITNEGNFHTRLAYWTGYLSHMYQILFSEILYVLFLIELIKD